MVEAVGVTVLGALLSATLPKLLDKISTGTSNKDVRDAVSSVRGELTSVERLVQAEEVNHKYSTEWNTLTTEMQGLAMNIQDYIDRFFKIKKIEADEFVQEIKGIKTQVENKGCEMKVYLQPFHNGTQTLPQQRRDADPDDMEIPSAPSFVGMEESKRDLQALIHSLNQKKKHRVISVLGFGGLGKTCLARQVMEQERKNNPSTLFGYVCVIGTEIQDFRNRMARLRAKLESKGQKRYFIVIDGVQEMELAVIIRDSVRKLHNNVNQEGGIIIVTTTVKDIAECCKSSDGRVYKMRPLGSQESEELFNSVHNERPPPNANRWKEIEEEFCDGVPLALISMATFCQADDYCECNEAWKDFSGANGIRKKAMKAVLERSINQDLPPGGRGTRFRAGLLYFSLFPRGHRVRKGSLIRRWIAEEGAFLCGGNGNMGDGAKDCFKALVDTNIIWPTQVSINEVQDAVKTCRVPRAMHGYISRDNFDPNTAHRNIKDHRWRSLQPGADLNVLSNEESSKLRTLLVFTSTDGLISSTKNCHLLQVLDLAEASCGNENFHLGTIGEQLQLLKYLSLNADIISHVVGPEIEKFKRLETLDLGKKEVEVNVNVFKLPELKHLLGKLRLDKSSTKFWFWPWNKSFNGKSLETVAGFVTYRGSGFPSMMDSMESLTKVKLFFGCPTAKAAGLTQDLSNHITTFINRTSKSTSSKEKRLSIDFQNCTPEMEESKAIMPIINKKNGLEIFSLKLRGKGEWGNYPDFGAKLSSITKLCLSWTNLLLGFTNGNGNNQNNGNWYPTFMDVLGEMEKLLYLKLVATDDIKVPPNAAIQAVPIKKDHFKNLERLCLMVMAEKETGPPKKGTLPMIAVQDNALQKLASLHLICKGLGGPAEVMCKLSQGSENVVKTTNGFPTLGGLKGITLHAEVSSSTKKAWHEAARKHQNRPQVLFIEDPKRSG